MAWGKTPQNTPQQHKPDWDWADNIIRSRMTLNNWSSFRRDEFFPESGNHYYYVTGRNVIDASVYVDTHGNVWGAS